MPTVNLTLTGQALSKVDDTNVTLTLGGTPLTALLRATSITVGWTGQLSVARGGTGLNGIGTSLQFLRTNAAATALEYFTPSTSDIPEGTNLYFTLSRVLNTVLTGLSITGSSIVSTDTVLEALGKAQNQINSLVGGVNYQGTWNATTNSPALASGVGTKGYYYVVSVAGATNLDGITDWKLGDWAIFNGATWQKVDNTDAVISVNGYTGTVVLTKSDLGLGNLDNTSDANKPVSTAQQTALDLKLNKSSVPCEFIVACSDLSTALTTGTTKAYFRAPYAFTLTAVRASLGTAQTSGSIFTVDVNENGASVLSTKLTIDNTETTSTTAATPPVISDNSISDDSVISIDIDQVGDGTAKGLIVTLIGTHSV